ncbi:MAG: transposase [Candidatus Izemoplasmataceae bacterium]
MGRPKGGKNREWSKGAKYKIVQRYLNKEVTQKEFLKRERICNSQLQKWIKAYDEHGIKGLENKRKPGNPLVKFQAKKNLTELEKLQYENMKLRIENERLKKGYTNEEAMSIRRRK